MSLDSFQETEEVLGPELSERLDSEVETEATTAAPINSFGPLSEEVLGDAGAMYLHEIGNHELLTALDEVSLAAARGW